jgi:HAMP domain-containing protein
LRLPTKLALVVLPPVMIPLISIGWLANKEVRDEVNRTSLNQMNVGLQFVIHQVNTLLKTAKTNAELFATSPLLKRYVQNQDDTQQRALLQSSLMQQFRNYQNAYPEYRQICLQRPDGSEDLCATSVQGTSSTENHAILPNLSTLIESKLDLITEVRRNANNGENALYLFRRLIETATDKPTITYGFLVLTVSLEKLYRDLEQHKIGHKGRILLVDKSGAIIFDNLHQATNTRLPVVVWNVLKSGANLSRPHKYYFLDQTFLIQAKAFDSQLYTLVALPTDELEKPVIRPTIAALLATLSALILYTSLVWTGMHHVILRPVKALHRAISEIDNGNLHPTLNITSRDELGDMAKSIQRMSQKLAEHSQEIGN